MFADIVALMLAVIVILFCAELFTNGIEWFGHILKLPERTIGSILAALGTSLPETVVPFVAVIGFGKSHGDEVSIGAIVGAPFMLATLAFAACGTAIWLRARNKHSPSRLNIDNSLVVRNLQYFLVAYSVGLLSAFLPTPLRWLVAFCLVLVYPVYVLHLVAQPASPASSPERLHISKLLLRESSHVVLVILQIVAGLAGIICGAYVFVDHLQVVALNFNVSPLLMSLVLTPIATELPEQATSVAWALKGKNNLALGTISGSMVFKSCFPVAFGLAFTSWKIDTQILLTALVSIILIAIYMIMAKKKILSPIHLMSGALIYITTMAIVICSSAGNH